MEEIKHYCQAVASIQKTIAIQSEADKIHPHIEKEGISLSLTQPPNNYFLMKLQNGTLINAENADFKSIKI